MTTHAYLDETKAKGYVMCAAWVTAGAISDARSAVRDLILKGQRSVHMRSDSDRRRRLICSSLVAMAEIGVEVAVYDAGRRHGTELRARGLCLNGVLDDARTCRPPVHIVLDRDETLVSWDRQRIITWLRESPDAGIDYRHERLADEPLLSIPDAVAWCYARSSTWRQRVDPLIRETRHV